MSTKLILSGSADKTVKIWNYETYELVQALRGHTETINSIVYIPYTRYIVSSGCDKNIKIWNYITYELLHTLYKHTNYVNCVNYIEDTD